MTVIHLPEQNRNPWVHDTSKWIRKQTGQEKMFNSSSPSCGYFSSNVQVWELDYRESWVPKIWCFWTVPFFSHLQSFPASGSFPMSQLFASGGQSVGASASVSVLPMNIQDWFPLGWTGWISISPRDSQDSSPTPQFKSMNSSALSFLCSTTLTSIHDYWKNHSFDLVSKVMSLLFNMLSRLVIDFFQGASIF